MTRNLDRLAYAEDATFKRAPFCPQCRCTMDAHWAAKHTHCLICVPDKSQSKRTISAFVKGLSAALAEAPHGLTATEINRKLGARKSNETIAYHAKKIGAVAVGSGQTFRWVLRGP